MSVQVPLAAQETGDESLGTNGSKIQNLFAERAPPESKYPFVLLNTPGSAMFCALPTFPVLGMQVMEDHLYVATPTKFYRVTEQGTYAELGDVNFSGRVSMATNGTYIVMVDGINGYYYSFDDGVMQLSGEGWYAADSATFLDGYFVFNRAGTGQFFISDLYSVEFDALNFATAESAPDDTLFVVADHGELWLFGQHTVEVWYNSGDPDFTFEKMQGVKIERGLGAKHSVAKLDNSLFWVGEDGVVYRAARYSPMRVSTHDVEDFLAVEQASEAYAFSYYADGHPFYVLTIPYAEKTLVYDVSTGLWHSRSHSLFGRHHACCYARCYGHNFVGDYQGVGVYYYSRGHYFDNSEPIIRKVTTPQLHFGRDDGVFFSFEIDMDAGVGLVTGQGSDPKAMLRFSDDGGRTWSHEYWTDIGKAGEYRTRVRWNRLGMSRNRIFEVTISDPIPVRIYGAYVNSSPGLRVGHAIGG